MAYQKFDIRKLERLNDPGRFDALPPDVLWAAMDLEVVDTVIEIGAGTGLFASAFARKSPGTTFYAVDTEETMLAWIRENRPEVSAGAIVPVKARETNVPLADGIADAVYMINLHHELEQPGVTYGEALRLLAPGGRLLVSDWAPVDSPKGPPQAIRVEALLVAEMLAGLGFDDIRTHAGALPYHWLVTATKPSGE